MNNEDMKAQRIIEAHERKIENQRKKRADEKQRKINSMVTLQTKLGFEPLKDFEEFYKINREGQIWSNHYDKILKNTICEDGYEKITLTNEIKNNNKRSIHRLLAIQYIPNPDNLEDVDHIDMNKLNNNLDNLRWVSRSINCRNRDSSYKTQGSLCECFDKKRNKVYYKAQYRIDYNVNRSKSSDDRQVCEDWLEQMMIQYPRDNKI